MTGVVFSGDKQWDEPCECGHRYARHVAFADDMKGLRPGCQESDCACARYYDASRTYRCSQCGDVLKRHEIAGHLASEGQCDWCAKVGACPHGEASRHGCDFCSCEHP